MKRFLFLIISFVLIQNIYVFQGVTEGGVWKVFKKGEALFYYYFEETMRKSSEGVISIWVRTLPQNEISPLKILDERQASGVPLDVEPTDDYGYSLLFLKVHCEDQLAMIIQEKVYNKKGFLLGASFISNEWTSLPQGSFVRSLSKQVCPHIYVQK